MTTDRRTKSWAERLTDPDTIRAQVHALLAIADALTDKPCETCARRDAYAAREAEQRDAADYADQPVCGRCGRDAQGREWPICADLVEHGGDREEAHAATCERYWGDGQDWVCDECEAASSHETPPSTPAAPQGGAVDGSKSQRRNLNAQRGEVLECPKCGHELWYHQAARSDESACVICTDDLPLGAPKCYLGVDDIARTLIDRAVKAERHRLAQEVRYAASESQRRGELSAFDRLTDEWEAR